jgi:hypothetical protein
MQCKYVFYSGPYLKLPSSKGVIISLKEKGGIIIRTPPLEVLFSDLNQTPQVHFRGRSAKKGAFF